ncbi:MAG: hypothetical protein COB35_06560 [Gammaproteobacteria bacterium]|nr:MAG: hypothetical protein COB35_06560 [Gammaproteobacteria bacterium]
MAKANSPIRLQNNLMQSATTVGALMHRSAAEQIEYWASLGQKVSDILSPEVLLSISAGLAKVSVKPTIDPVIDFDDIMQEVEIRSNSDELKKAIANNTIKYQASSHYPGLLEQVKPDGTITLGHFEGGEFVAEHKN